MAGAHPVNDLFGAQGAILPYACEVHVAGFGLVRARDLCSLYAVAGGVLAAAHYWPLWAELGSAVVSLGTRRARAQYWPY